MTERKNTVVQSPHDTRDWIYEGLALTVPATIPNTFDLRPYLPPVRDQGARGTCAAFTAACIKEYHEKIDNVEFEGNIAPDSIYFYRSNKPQEGMYCRDIMSILTKYGAAQEKYCPYSSKEPKSLSAECIKDAKRFVIKGYAQINTIAAAKQALMISGPLLIAFPYYNNGIHEFWRVKGKIEGGHAVAIVGWTEQGFIIRNSWGSNWADNGHIIYPFSEYGGHWELWACVDAETVWTPPPPPPPPAPPAPAPKPKAKVIVNLAKRLKEIQNKNKKSTKR